MSEESEAEPDMFTVVVNRGERLLYPVRDSDLQRQALDELDELSRLVVEKKQQAISASNEDLANLHLGQECVIAWLHAELNMWC